MSSLTELASNLDSENSQPMGEGFLSLVTSAGNYLYFRSPASLTRYQRDPVNAAQLGVNRGQGDVRGR